MKIKNMKFKKIFSVILALTIGATMMIGCSKKEEGKQNVKEINLTYVKSPLNVPSIIEKNNKSFGKEFGKDSIKVNWHELTTGPEQTQALAAGELQFLHALGGTSAILAAANGVDLKIIGVYSRAPKAFMIITKNDSIKSAKDLKGKKIAGPKGTVLHQLLVSVLEKNNMKQEDVKFINMGIPEALAALNNKNVDAALLGGPAALKAMKSEGRLVANGQGLVEGTIVTAVSSKFLKENPEIVDRFKKTHKDTVDYIKNNVEEAIKTTSKEVSLTEDETKQMYKWYNFDTNITKKDIEELKKTQEFMVKNGLQKDKIKIEDLIAK